MVNSSNQLHNRWKSSTKKSADHNKRTTSGKRDSSMRTMGQWYLNDFSYTPLNAVTHMKTCKISSSMKRWRNCQSVTQQGMRWERPQPHAKPLTDKMSWSEESLQVHTEWMLFISSGTSTFKTRSHWTQLTLCVLFDLHFEEFQFCIWSFKMADNCHDLYSRSCMMQSMTTTTSSNGMINDQDGASTCQKLTYLRLLIPRFLPIVNALTRPLANRKQPRRQHQHWAECQKRKHHHQQHGEPSEPLLRQNKLQ